MTKIHDAIEIAMDGAKLWKEIIEQYGNNVQWFFLFDTDTNLIDFILEYITIYKNKNKSSQIGVIYTKPEWKMFWGNCVCYFEHELYIDSQKAESLIRYYELREFTKNIIFVSLNRPYGRNLERMMELGIPKKDLIVKGIMQLSCEDINNVEYN